MPINDVKEADLRNVCDRGSLFRLLEGLGWRVSAEDTYTYAYDGPALNENVAARASVSQIVPFGSHDPFALILVEFATGFRRGDLRDILQAVRADVRKRASYGGKALDDIVFVCATEDYGGVRFVHFESKDAARQPRLRVFGWDCDQTDGMRTLRDHNLTCLRLPHLESGAPDWKTAEATWRTAWDVERVTREFYTDYERVFKGVEQQVTGVQGDRRLWVQRLMNRLLFVQFLSKKKPAWLRFGERTDYLPALYEQAVNKGENFYEDRLWWAFFCGLGTLSDDVEEHGHENLRERRGEVPFLNGGLFDRIDKNDDQHSGVHVPNHAFAPVLALFAQYNFTITESAPDDADVAVDPEMLGKVFERLVTGRHESGSYYTPRGIVTFMCRESLKQYLMGAVGSETPNGAVGANGASDLNGGGEERAAIEAFVERRDASGLRRPEAVLGALRHITVCDPACGSGAYLLGMMQELLALRQSLFASKVQDFSTVYERKREIIQHNIYGADKDPFAVSIAMLRLWLSLTIENRCDPHDMTLAPAKRDVSLPNLKFKVVVGDSLTAPDPSNLNLMGDAYSRDADTLRNCHNNYFTAHDGGTGAVGSKAKIEAQVRKAEASLSDLFGDMARPTNDDGSLRVVWHVAFAEVFAPRREAGDLGGGLNLGLTLAPPPTPGGFDIVLANPPYVRQELIKDIKPLLKQAYAAIYNGTADLYTYFYARAVQLLKPGGVLAFISPNKWFRAGYGAHLRKYIADKCDVHSITDFGDLPVFENATTYPMIFVADKKYFS